MSCRVEWTQKFLHSTFDKEFLKTEYVQHRRNVLIEREMGYLPETQPHVEFRNQIRLREGEIMDLQRKVNDKIQDLRAFRYERSPTHQRTAAQRPQYILKCPQPECRGFVNSQWNCELCNTQLCNQCREPLSTDHICNQETVQTVALLARDTKPCPQCATLINKIDGCNQMFCVSCHTAFDWVSLRIATGPIHNPHYFAWIRENPGDNEDVLLEGRRGCREIRMGDIYKRNFVEIATLHASHFERLKTYLVSKLSKGEPMSNREAIEFLEMIPIANMLDLTPQPSVSKNGELDRFLDSYLNRILRERVQEPTRSRVHILVTNALKDAKITEIVPVFKARQKYITGIVQLIHHVSQVEMTGLRDPVMRPFEENLQLRIQYMMKEVDEEKFKRRVVMDDKRILKRRELFAIYEMFHDSVEDCLHRWIGGHCDYATLTRSLIALQQYSTDTYREILLMFGTSKDTLLYREAGAKFGLIVDH
jgi:hypothetical protein